ncbi:MAG: class I poly(R)-hydroxyalkanoic acid synthase [Hyphomicrobiaceae bacterium]
MTDSTSKTDQRVSSAGEPEELVCNALGLFAEWARAMSGLLARSSASGDAQAAVRDLYSATGALGEIADFWMSDPARMMAAQSALYMSYVELWSASMRRALGEDVEPVVEPEPADNRFKDPEWSSNPYFDFCKQAYLLTSNWAEEYLHKTNGLDEKTRDKAEFYLRLMTSAMSPSNFPMTNPVVMREALGSKGKNFIAGMKQFISDLEKSGDLFTISQTDTSAFEVGRNLAVTPGKIIFQNELFQLIQYEPATDKVREVPLLIVPPWINKYYILDLSEQKSFVKFAVSQGFTVFMISWVNPDKRLAQKNFEDYVAEGLLTAADAVSRETGVARCSVLGYCIGGTLLGTTLAYLAERGEERFSSATFLTTQFDFSLAGNLTIFTDDEHIAGIEELMKDRGYLDSSRIATVFNMMRPRDLIWPYVVNNYLLGKKPAAFDILYWNQDSTRMPAANHKFYLREFYASNKLAKGELALTDRQPSSRGHSNRELDHLKTNEDHIVFYLRGLKGSEKSAPLEMTLSSIKLNLKKVRIPIYELATREDHIAPAASVFKGSQLFDCDVEFVLSGSGHIAGVVNPPAKAKYQYWTAPLKPRQSLEEWMSSAKEHPGSWWTHWAEWLAQRSGGFAAPRAAGNTLGIIEDAPGSYVRKKG